ICNHPSWSFVLQSSDAEAHREFWRTPRTLHFESQLDSHALARSGVNEKPNDPLGKPAGFSSAGRDVCSEKPNDPPGKPAGFEVQNSLTGAHREPRALNT
ncbi:MAG: hypothetical protein J5I93_06720, partial [Pirellulaceae bacterium]|nr:hypothetical protein [Pirellulaceae bacterium]